MPKPRCNFEVSDESIDASIKDITDKLQFRLNQKGRFSYISTHEALGKITEEFWEYVEAVKNNDDEEIIHELKDIAVGCIFAIASLKERDVVLNDE